VQAWWPNERKARPPDQTPMQMQKNFMKKTTINHSVNAGGIGKRTGWGGGRE